MWLAARRSGRELGYLMKSPTKKVVREAVLVVLLFSVWSTFEILTGYSEHARWYGLLSVAIAAGVATGTVPRWAGILMSERSVRSRKNTAKWKLIAVGALIAGCLGWWPDVPSERLVRTVLLSGASFFHVLGPWSRVWNYRQSGRSIQAL